MRRFFALVLLLAVCLTAAFLLFGSHFDLLAQELLVGPNSMVLAFVIVALLAGDVALPVPSSLLASSAGIAFGPVLGGLLAAFGISLGACGGFLLARKCGSGFCRRLAGEEEFVRIGDLLDRHGPALLVVFRPVPLLAETSVLAAGAGGAPLGRSLAVLVLGSAGMGFGYAFLGALALESHAFLVAAGVSIVLPAIALLGWRNVRVAGDRLKKVLARHRR